MEGFFEILEGIWAGKIMKKLNGIDFIAWLSNYGKRMGNTKKLISIGVIFFSLPVLVYLTIIGVKYFSRAAASPATLAFSQNPLLLNATSSSSENIVLNAGSAHVGFVAVKFTFDQTKMKLVSEVVPTTTLKKVIIQTSMADANTSGAVRLVLGLDPADINSAPTGSFNVGELQLQALSNNNSSSNLTFATSDIEIVDMNATNMDVTATNATVTIGNVTSTLNFSVKMQGANVAVAGKTAKVSIKTGATTVASQSVTLTNGVAGVYSGSLQNVNPGTYDVYIKETNHLQKKFAGVVVTSGTTTKDFTSTPLVAGDYNNDNKIDITDLGLLLSKYIQLSVPVDTSNGNYDVNGDGVINITDVAVVLSNYTALSVYGD